MSNKSGRCGRLKRLIKNVMIAFAEAALLITLHQQSHVLQTFDYVQAFHVNDVTSSLVRKM